MPVHVNPSVAHDSETEVSLGIGVSAPESNPKNCKQLGRFRIRISVRSSLTVCRAAGIRILSINT